jgi:hypothetical protein
MQDLKFPNCFSKNPFKICDFLFFFLKEKIGAKFLKSQRRTQFVVCMQFFLATSRLFPNMKLIIFFFFFKKKNLNTTKINQEQIFFFFGSSRNPKEKETKKNKKPNPRCDKI